MHARRAIVNAAATAVTGLATTGSRVYPGRTRPVKAETAPHLLVYGRQETSTSATMRGAARKLARELRLTIEGVEASTTDTDELLDTIAEEVETAIAADPTLGGKCKDLWLIQTDIGPAGDDAAERRIAAIRLTFAVMYLTEANAPATAA